MQGAAALRALDRAPVPRGARPEERPGPVLQERALLEGPGEPVG
jgi:hypothetical protein